MNSLMILLSFFLATLSTFSSGQFLGHGLLGGLAHHQHSNFLGGGILPNTGGGFIGGIGHHHGGFLGGLGHGGLFLRESNHENANQNFAQVRAFSPVGPTLGHVNVPGFEKDLWLIYPLKNNNLQQRAAGDFENFDSNSIRSSSYPPLTMMSNPGAANNLLSLPLNQARIIPPNLFHGSAGLSLYADQGSDNRKDLISYGIHNYGVRETDYGFGNKPPMSIYSSSDCCRCPPVQIPTSYLPMNLVAPYHNAHISQGYALNGYGVTGAGTNGNNHEYGIQGKFGLL